MAAGVVGHGRVKPKPGMHLAAHQSQVAAPNRPRLQCLPQKTRSLARACNQQRSRGSVVKAMDQPSFKRPIAGAGGFGKTRHDAVHRGGKLAGSKGVAGHRSGFVYNDDRGIAVKYLESYLRVGDNRGRFQAALSSHLDLIVGGDEKSLGRETAIDSYAPRAYQRGSFAAGRRVTRPNEEAIQPFAESCPCDAARRSCRHGRLSGVFPVFGR